MFVFIFQGMGGCFFWGGGGGLSVCPYILPVLLMYIVGFN